MTNEIILELVKSFLENRKNIEELQLKIMKLERGNETLQERIKEKDNIIGDLKQIVEVLKFRMAEKK